jgi:PEP-CTERM motif
MTHRQQIPALLAGSALIALMAVTDARAAIYTGIVQTSFGDPVGDTTDAPASYQTAVGAETAVSTTSSAKGGNGFVRATSFSGLATASASIDYIIRLVGPGGSVVPVGMLASGYADGVGYYNSRSSITVTQGSNVLALRGAASPRQAPVSANGRFEFVIDQTLLLEPNVDYRVFMTAMASSGTLGVRFGSFAEAYVDPVFTIDAAFAPLYTLTGVPAVPEPGTWGLMLSGVGLLALATRRLRRTEPELALQAIQRPGQARQQVHPKTQRSQSRTSEPDRLIHN